MSKKLRGWLDPASEEVKAKMHRASGDKLRWLTQACSQAWPPCYLTPVGKMHYRASRQGSEWSVRVRKESVKVVQP